VLLPPQVHFLRDVAEKLARCLAKVCAFSMLVLAHVPRGVLRGGEDFLAFFIFSFVFHRE
jgi:hypothetical protein